MKHKYLNLITLSILLLPSVVFGADILKEKILQNVPFTSQAPYGKWSDLRQEDGCEEASSLMAVNWALGKKITKKEAESKILGSSNYTLKKYKEYRDISVIDTVNWIIKDYFAYKKAAVKKNISLADLILEIKKGNIIIAPLNGRLVGNPHYTAPGPINHMLVIRGYDPLKKQFITNDPGTRYGELYKYNAQTLFSAIRSYPTGSHEANNQINKDVIVVWK